MLQQCLRRCLVCADIVISTDPQVACKDVDIAVMVGGFPRKAGMERQDVMAKNVAIYKSQAAALQSAAKRDVKVKVPFALSVCKVVVITQAPACSVHGCSASIPQEGRTPLSRL